MRGGAERILPWSEICDNGYHMITTSAQLRENDLSLLNNSEDELPEAVQEMIAALEDGFGCINEYCDASMLIEQKDTSISVDPGPVSKPSITFLSTTGGTCWWNPEYIDTCYRHW